MNIVLLNNKIEAFVQKYDLSKDALSFKKDNAINSSSEWQKILDSFNNEERVLRIGIIGRVKAGKSSMLNALLFDGQDILPKAATPMTAALTIIQYSEKIHAEVDFFSQQDIDEIGKKHSSYIQKLNQLKRDKFENNKNRLLQKKKKEIGFFSLPNSNILSDIETKDCESKAISQAEREMKNDHNYASFDQYQRILESGKKPSDLEEFQTIKANTIEDLMNGELNQFVGSSGVFMPFTKSVSLHIPHNGLKGLEIIDTPGINDPVTSRGERTEELLQHCDVVLVVSPSGQFLSAEDNDLLHRVTTKEGTQEAYLIASQVDNQLFGNERGSSTDPIEVLGRVSNALTAHARSVLQKQVQNFPEMQIAAEKLSRNQVICSSSVAYTMNKLFNQRNTWDDNLDHVWSNLSHFYPGVFANAGTAKKALSALANIETLQKIIEEITVRKKEIQQQRRINFESDKRKSLKAYLENWATYIDNQIYQIKNTDVGELRKQEQALSDRHSTLTAQVGLVYEDLVVEVKLDLDKQMKDKLATEMRKLDSASSEAQGSKTESKEVYKGRGGFLWLKKKYETVYYDVNTVNATSIRRAIEEFRSQLEDSLNYIATHFQQAWKKKIYAQLVGTLREIMGDEELDINIIIRAVRNILAKIPESDFSIQDDLPPSLKKNGTLKSDEADYFNSEAENYVDSLRKNVRNDINKYMYSFLSNLQSINLPSELAGNLEDNLKQLLSEIENKEASLHHYSKMQKELQALQNEAHV